MPRTAIFAVALGIMLASCRFVFPSPPIHLLTGIRHSAGQLSIFAGRSGHSLLSELKRTQDQDGLSLVTVENRLILLVIFSHRSFTKAGDVRGGIGAVSPDGARVAFGTDSRNTSYVLAISQSDGSSLREYPNVRIPPNVSICWSDDQSKLLIGTTPPWSSALQLVDTSSGAVHEIVGDGRITTQCWAPDNRHFVYEDATLRIYDVEQNRSDDLEVRGTNPTWSPDGSRISFLDGETYYTIDAKQANRPRPLFKKWHAESGLLWSPDSRLVAYVSQASAFEGGLLFPDVETYWLRVRRLEDGSELRVSGAEGGAGYEWVTSKNLFKVAQSNIGRWP
jgi:WD40-like Beta Propeller Repeat